MTEKVDLSILFEEVRLDVGCGDQVLPLGETKLGAFGPMIVRSRRLVQCHGGFTKFYDTRHTDGHELSWMECELDGEWSNEPIPPDIMERAGFHFEVGQVVVSAATAGANVAAQVITERILADVGGTVQRFYRASGPTASSVVQAAAIESMGRGVPPLDTWGSWAENMPEEEAE